VSFAGATHRAAGDPAAGEAGATSWLEAEVDRRAASRQSRALAVFDALDELFHRRRVDGCWFVNTPPDPLGFDMPIHQANSSQLAVTAATLEDYAEEAGAADPEETGCKLQILVTGAIVSAGRGDEEAARRARALAERLLESSRSRSPGQPGRPADVSPDHRGV
jgi:hypothetical protein